MFQQPFDMPLKRDSMSTLNASKLMVMEVAGINIRKRLKADAAKQIPTLNKRKVNLVQTLNVHVQGSEVSI